MAKRKRTPPLPEVFLEQIIERSNGGEADSAAIRPLRVRIYKPMERADGEWSCTFEFQKVGDPEPHRVEFTGVDSLQALFYAQQVAENMVGRRYVPTPPDIFVERVLDYVDGKTTRPVTVRVYKPVQHGPDEWGCIMEFQGLHPSEPPYRHETRGADSVQALFLTLQNVAVEIDRYKGQFSWAEGKPWESAGFRGTPE